MTRRRIVVGVLLLVALGLGLGSACFWWHTQRLCVKVTDDTAAGFAFEVGGPGCEGTAHIRTVTVWREGVDIWGLAGDQRAHLSVRYGVAAPGFSTYRPQPLRPGDKVSISVRGPGVRGSANVTLR